ncbi:cytochrome c [Flavobacteriaceae bacterium]|nr:cytochrome c [Flavobacteriaceae bacterium]
MKNIVNIVVTILIMLSVTSCFDKKKPNYRYMPNMYTSVAVETYSEYEILPNGQAALTPVKGTISRGWMPYEYENTQEGKALATKELKIPLAVNEENLAKGKGLFNIYCAICHGNKGDGQGTLVKREKFLGIPSLADKGRNITEGDIYHVMMYGLNSMGSYASQTNEKERWQITMHALDLKSKLNGEPLWSSTQKDSMEKETTSNEAN